MFELPRRKREPYDDETRVTIRNIIEMENRIMSAIEAAVAELTSAIADANSRFQNVGSLETALAEERAKYDALVAAEEAEDVQQNQELEDAKAATDAALAEVQGAADSISALTTRVNNLGTVAAQDTPEATGVTSQDAVSEGAPAEATADATPAEAPAEAPAPTPPPADATGDAAPAEAPADATTTDAAAAEAPAPADQTSTTDVSDQTEAATATDTTQNTDDTPVAPVDEAPQPADAAPSQAAAPTTSTDDPTDTANMTPNV